MHLLEKRIRVVTMDPSYIIFTYQTQDNQQECFKLSDLFFLRCFGPWMYHLPPVWWSDFMFMFLNDILWVSLTQWRGIFYWWLDFIILLVHCSSLTYHFLLTWLYSEKLIYTKYFLLSYSIDVLSTVIIMHSYIYFISYGSRLFACTYSYLVMYGYTWLCICLFARTIAHRANVIYCICTRLGIKLILSYLILITCPVKCCIELFILSQTSTAASI